MKEFVYNQLHFILNYAEFISGERPRLQFTDIASKLRILQENIQKSTGKFLKGDAILDLQWKLMQMIITWNSAISPQLTNLNNYYVDLNKKINPSNPLTLKSITR